MRGKDTETEFMDCMDIGKADRDRKGQHTGKGYMQILGNDTYEYEYTPNTKP
jgi:hypothetical protein